MNRKYTTVNSIETFINYYDIDKIYLDVDGVLIHSCQAICDILNEDKGTNFTGDQVLSWNFKEVCPDLIDADIELLFADDRFFKYVKWIDGAREFINRHENDIIIVTKGTYQNIFRKTLFFNRHNMKVIIKGLPLDTSKGEIDMSDGLFIDDCTKNLVESNAKYKVQFCEYDDGLNEQREWIKGFDGLKMYKWA
jgi:hypothetical protein